MTKFAVLILLLTSTQTMAKTIRLFECTSDDTRIEKLTVDKYITTVHGEDSIYHEVMITGEASAYPPAREGEPAKYWIDNAPAETDGGFAARFRDFKNFVEVDIKAPVAPEYLLTTSTAKINGEVVEIYCGYSLDPQCKDGSCRTK